MVTAEIISWILTGMAVGIAIGAACGGIIGYIVTRGYYRNQFPEYDPESFDITLQPIPVRAAKYCVDCDVLFNTNLTNCPICTSGAWAWLANWIMPPVREPSDGDLEKMYSKDRCCQTRGDSDCPCCEEGGDD